MFNKGIITKIIISLCLAALLLPALCSCARTLSKNTETTASETTASVGETTKAFVGQTKVRVVYKEGSSYEIKSLASLLFRLLSADAEIDASISNDEDTPADDVFEFLLGTTNRDTESTQPAPANYREYYIKNGENNLYIKAGSIYALGVACNVLTENYDNMKNNIFSAQVSETGIADRSEYLIGITNQANSSVEIYDASAGVLNKSSLVWQYEMTAYNVAGLCFRETEQYGTVVLAVCGSSYGCMVDYDTKELIWSTYGAANNPHAIELLPNGVVAIASSTGNEVRFFNSASKDGRYTFMPLTEAHGVLYDPTLDILWALGNDVLTAFKVSLNDGQIKVSNQTQYKVALPSSAGHDLVSCTDDANCMWVTTGSNVYRFDKTTLKFTTDYKNSSLINTPNVKGIGAFENGYTFKTTPDGGGHGWTTETVIFVKPLPDGSVSAEKLVGSGALFYKVKIFSTKY